MNLEENVKSKAKIRLSKSSNFSSTENIFCQMARRLGEQYLSVDTAHSSPLPSRAKNNNSRKKETATKATTPRHEPESAIGELDETKMLENIPYGDDLRENTELSIMEHSKSRHEKRTTLRDEILLAQVFQNKVPGYFQRKNYDLMRIVEDQVISIFFLNLFLYSIENSHSFIFF